MTTSSAPALANAALALARRQGTLAIGLQASFKANAAPGLPRATRARR